MKKDKHSEDINFKLYDQINDFTIGEIAKLWCGIDIYAQIPPDKLPEAEAIGRKIIGAIMSKDLKSKISSSERNIDEELRRINYEIISKDMTSHVLWATGTFINKNDLVNWAIDNKQKPKFLFHGGKEISSSFPTDTKWEDMTWTLLAHDLVRVEVKGISKRYNYSDLGFTDKRKGDHPDNKWAIFIIFAENNGEVDWNTKLDKKQSNNLSAVVKDIRKRLKNFFNISDDPFHPYRQTKSYKTKFTIIDARENRDEVNSKPEDFSEEAIQQYIEDDAEFRLHQETGRTNTNYDEEK